MNLANLVEMFGAWGIWAVVLAESGLFLFFLPGDSLLFIAGYLSSRGLFNFWTIVLGCLVAAIVGNLAGYWIGAKLGPKIFNHNRLKSAHKFYKLYGAWAIFLARFIPVVRTFSPMIAGAAKMNYSTFVLYNIAGAVIWVLSFTVMGYFLGHIPFLKDNFTVIIFIIIVISILPVLFHKK